MEFSRVVYQGMNGEQWRLTCSDFRDVEYLHLRKYYQDMEGEYHPTKTGAAMPLTIHNSWALFLALAELLSQAEVDDVTQGLGDIYKDYELNNSTTIPRERIRGLLQGSSDDS